MGLLRSVYVSPRACAASVSKLKAERDDDDDAAVVTEALLRLFKTDDVANARRTVDNNFRNTVHHPATAVEPPGHQVLRTHFCRLNPR